MSQLTVDESSSNFAIFVTHLSPNKTILSQNKVTEHKSRDIFAHNGNTSQVYVCLKSNTSKPLLIEVIPMLQLPDLGTIPTDKDANLLNYELRDLNSRLLHLINNQEEFDENERKGMEVGGRNQANLRLDSGLRSILYFQVAFVVAIAAVQYLLFRVFAHKAR